MKRLVAFFSLALLWSTCGQAGAMLLKLTPANGSVTDKPPSTFVLQFSEAVQLHQLLIKRDDEKHWSPVHNVPQNEAAAFDDTRTSAHRRWLYPPVDRLRAGFFPRCRDRFGSPSLRSSSAAHSPRVTRRPPLGGTARRVTGTAAGVYYSVVFTLNSLASFLPGC